MWALSGSHDSFLHFWAQAISLERMKLDISNLVSKLNVKCTQCTAITRDLLNFWDISAIISLKRCKIDIQLQWSTNRKSLVSYRMAPISMTLNVT